MYKQKQTNFLVVLFHNTKMSITWMTFVKANKKVKKENTLLSMKKKKVFTLVLTG